MSRLDPRVFHFQEEIHTRPNNPSLKSNHIKGAMSLFKGGPLQKVKYQSINRSDILHTQRKIYQSNKAQFQSQLGQKYAEFLYRHAERQRSKSQLSNYGSNTLLKSHQQGSHPELGSISDKDKYYFSRMSVVKKQQMIPKITQQQYVGPLLAGRYTFQQKNYVNKKQEYDYNYSHIRLGFRPKMLNNCDDLKGIVG